MVIYSYLGGHIMSVASLVLGIVSVIVAFIPFCGWFALAPSVVGLALGGAGFSKAKKEDSPTGMATAGIVLNIIALAFVLFWILVIVA
jgi:hypothetical protein